MMLDPALEDAGATTADAATDTTMMGLETGMNLDFGLGAAPASVGMEGWELLDFLRVMLLWVEMERSTLVFEVREEATIDCGF